MGQRYAVTVTAGTEPGNQANRRPATGDKNEAERKARRLLALLDDAAYWDADCRAQEAAEGLRDAERRGDVTGMMPPPAGNTSAVRGSGLIRDAGAG